MSIWTLVNLRVLRALGASLTRRRLVRQRSCCSRSQVLVEQKMARNSDGMPLARKNNVT